MSEAGRTEPAAGGGGRGPVAVAQAAGEADDWERLALALRMLMMRRFTRALRSKDTP